MSEQRPNDQPQSAEPPIVDEGSAQPSWLPTFSDPDGIPAVAPPTPGLSTDLAFVIVDGAELKQRYSLWEIIDPNVPIGAGPLRVAQLSPQDLSTLLLLQWLEPQEIGRYDLVRRHDLALTSPRPRRGHYFYKGRIVRSVKEVPEKPRLLSEHIDMADPDFDISLDEFPTPRTLERLNLLAEPLADWRQQVAAAIVRIPDFEPASLDAIASFHRTLPEPDPADLYWDVPITPEELMRFVSHGIISDFERGILDSCFNDRKVAATFRVIDEIATRDARDDPAVRYWRAQVASCDLSD